ncbi:phosphate ABC transporter substrate-binding/OmpA family protein [Litoreibacter roseus]|uniref:OmpA family protein n=1 Tax=Litoreibacter roseus TaxID=2601869 RepID=A0A6N6JGS8_9RHOB|nr:phosphate ABC transporter substrate-binding/OmpA family protein [Litoreibacter roseus]GFE64498.1 OmpA family protein [Litoreibacter roseus]
MSGTRAHLLALVLTIASAGWVWAEDVLLTSKDGAFRLDGTILSFDREVIRIDTVYGPLTVNREGVECTGIGCPAPDAIPLTVISGASRVGDVLMPALIRAFAASRGLSVDLIRLDPRTERFVLSRDDAAVSHFDLRQTTTREGFADLIAAEADIVMALREPTQTEQELAAEAEMGDLTDPRHIRVIALDGLVPTDPVGKIDSVSAEKLSFAYLRGSPSGAYARGYAEWLAVWRDGVSALDQVAALGQSDLGSETSGIGVAPFSSVDLGAVLPITGTCGITHRATQASLRTEDYPLTMPIMLYTPARKLPQHARAFLSYLQGDRANRIVRRSGFVDLALQRFDLAGQGLRLARGISNARDRQTWRELQRFVEDVRGFDRISMTFRFRDGTARLDAQSEENLSRFAQLLERGRFDGRQIKLIGFSDGVGPAEDNRDLSEDRAASVLDSVTRRLDASSVKLSAAGFGEILPVACDDTPWGRALNRRVEIWVD